MLNFFFWEQNVCFQQNAVMGSVLVTLFLLSVRKINWFADRFHSPLPFAFVSITCGVEGEVTMEAFAKTLMADSSTNLFFPK